jgi:hypothetical protein
MTSVLPHQDHFFCHGATKKTIDEWSKNGKKWKVNPNHPIGKNTRTLGRCPPLLCELAGLEKRIGNHSWHGYGINLMANATNVSLEESNNAARHKSTTTQMLMLATIVPLPLASEYYSLMAVGRVSYPTYVNN